MATKIFIELKVGLNNFLCNFALPKRSIKVPIVFGGYSDGKVRVHNLRGVVQLASMLAWGASGRRFESCHSDNKKVSLPFCKLTFFYWFLT